MVNNTYLDAYKQIPNLEKLENEGFINKFKHSFELRHIAELNYFFTLSEIYFNFSDKTIVRDFSKYQVKIIYGRFLKPKVFITSVIIDKTCPHVFGDGALCLYKDTNFKL